MQHAIATAPKLEIQKHRKPITILTRKAPNSTVALSAKDRRGRMILSLMKFSGDKVNVQRSDTITHAGNHVIIRKKLTMTVTPENKLHPKLRARSEPAQTRDLHLLRSVQRERTVERINLVHSNNQYLKQLIAVTLLTIDAKKATAVVRDVTNIEGKACLMVSCTKRTNPPSENLCCFTDSHILQYINASSAPIPANFGQ